MPALQIVPSGAALAAEVVGLDLSRLLAEAEAEALRAALLEHCVLVFRDQRLDEPAQVRFTAHFGRPQIHVRAQADRPVKEIFVISNVRRDGKPIGALGSGELVFHSDLSYMPMPGTVSVVYAIEVPATGGRTQWCNAYAAYEALDEATKRRLQELRAVHRHPEEAQNPPAPADHPVVRTHPGTGRKSLFVSPQFTRSIVGMPAAESDALLEALFTHLARPEFVWTHEWRVGDLVIWDNRPTLHRREPFPDTERRILKRTQVFGDEVPV